MGRSFRSLARHTEQAIMAWAKTVLAIACVYAAAALADVQVSGDASLEQAPLTGMKAVGLGDNVVDLAAPALSRHAREAGKKNKKSQAKKSKKRSRKNKVKKSGKKNGGKKNKGKKGKGKRKGRKGRLSKKKSGKKVKGRKNKKSRRMKKKSRKAKKSKKKLGRQAAANTTACPSEECFKRLLIFGPYYGNQARNFFRMSLRAKTQHEQKAKKLKKKGDYGNVTAAVQGSTGGGGGKPLTCNGKNVTDKNSTIQSSIATLEGCSKKLETSCGGALTTEKVKEMEDCNKAASAFRTEFLKQMIGDKEFKAA